VTERLLKAREVAEFLGLSRDVILDWWEDGRLPGFNLGDSEQSPVRFRLSEIEEWLASRHRNGPGAEGAVATYPDTPDPPLVSQVPPTRTE
jgi:excisionase family DNA binding protein